MTLIGVQTEAWKAAHKGTRYNSPRKKKEEKIPVFLLIKLLFLLRGKYRII